MKTQQQEGAFINLNQTIIFCPRGHQAIFSCFNKNCLKYSFLCSQKSCQCQKDHIKCVKAGTETIINNIYRKLNSSQQIQKHISQTIQKLIQQLKTWKNELMIQTNQKLKYIELNHQQYIFLTSIQQKSYQKITGKLILDILNDMNNQQRQNRQIIKIKSKIDEIWIKNEKQINKNKYLMENLLQIKAKEINKILFPNFKAQQLSQSQNINFFQQSKSLVNLQNHSTQIEKLIKIQQQSLDAAKQYEQLANICRSQEKFELAIVNFNKALQIYTKFDKKQQIGDSYFNIANMYFDQSQFQPALQNYYKSLQIYRKLEKQDAQADTLNSIANIYKNQSKYSQAIQNFNKAIQIFERIKKYENAADIYYNIACVYRTSQKFVQSIRNYNKALKIYVQLGNQQDIGETYMDIAKVLFDQSKFQEALQNYNKSFMAQRKQRNKMVWQMQFMELRILIKLRVNQRKLHKTMIEAFQFILNQVINNYNQPKDYLIQQPKFQLAIQNFQKSIQIYKKLKKDQQVGVIYNQIAIVYKKQYKFKKALQNYNKSLQICTSFGKQCEIALVLRNIGSLYKENDKIKQALQKYSKSSQIFQKLGREEDVADNLNYIAQSHKIRHRFKQALENHKKALKIYKQIGKDDKIALTLHYIGQVQANKQKYKQALQYYTKSLEIYQKIGQQNSLETANLLFNISIVYQKSGQFKKSFQSLSRVLKIRILNLGQNHSQTIETKKKLKKIKQMLN